MNCRTRTAGVILVGGKSRRMGWDKVQMTIHGTRVLERLLHEMEEICDEIVMAGRRDEEFDFLPHRKPLLSVPDAVPDRGPLGGVVSAMKASCSSSFLIIPCDMPFLGSAVLRRFVSQGKKYSAVVGPGRGFPVLLKKELLPSLEKALLRQDLCFFDVIEASAESIFFFSFENFKDLGDPQLTFFNVNTPDDFAFAERICQVVWR